MFIFKTNRKLPFLISIIALLTLPVHGRGNKPGNSPQIGEAAPQFHLPDINGKKVPLDQFQGKHVVLEWTNYECPFVKKHYGTNNMPNLQKYAAGKDVVWLSICSSAKGKQGHLTPAAWKTAVKERGAMPHAVLLDPDGHVGRLYGAKTTPHMFIVDPKGTLIYKGAIDNRPTMDPDDVPGASNHVKLALDEILTGRPVSTPITTPYGCSVKY